VGLFDIFRRRRERESAIHGLTVEAAPSQQVEPLSPGGQIDSPQEAEAAIQAGGFDLAQLGQIGQMIAQAAHEGSIQIHQGPTQSIDLSDQSALRDEIMEIMSEHGIDAKAGITGEIDASRLPAMQQQILEAIGRQQGIDLDALGYDPGENPTGEIGSSGGD
jgi:septum formation topological specificity factor MinE